MTPEQAARAERIIGWQIAASGQTIDALRRAGLTDSTILNIDFFFTAKDEKSARALASHLEANDCVSLRVSCVGRLLFKKYLITGKTLETHVTVEIIAQWLPWIVIQGVVHNCEFDGWGAEV